MSANEADPSPSLREPAGRLATPSDLPIIATIHKQAYSRNHFTALLPNAVLERYYAAFLAEGTEIYLALDGAAGSAERALGFAVYGLDIPGKIAVFKKSCAKAILLTSLRHPMTAAKKALQAVRARFTRGTPYPPADFLLLSIAVARPLTGVGKVLLRRLLDVAARDGHAIVGLYVNADNIRAINAYASAGFRIRNLEDGQYYMEADVRA